MRPNYDSDGAKEKEGRGWMCVPISWPCPDDGRFIPEVVHRDRSNRIVWSRQTEFTWLIPVPGAGVVQSMTRSLNFTTDPTREF